MKILILGVTGMLGHQLFKSWSRHPDHEVWGTLRQASSRTHFDPSSQDRILAGVDGLDGDALERVLATLRPDLVINCIGVIKQLAQANDPEVSLPVNALLPHRLARLCALGGARLVLISTDCVFSGRQGNYRESDPFDAEDLYGQSKYWGEIHDQSHVVTLRTSIIGHEISTHLALIDWFLAQKGTVKGYTRAIYSGLPTVELAQVILERVLPDPALHGLYHVASAPISKFDLLTLVGRQYGHGVTLVPDDRVAIDRSLNGERFAQATGYGVPPWPELVARMHQSR